DVVLDVRAALQVPVADVGIADAPRVAARPAGLERVEALEGERAEIVRRVVRTVRSAVHHHAHPYRMDAADVIEIRIEIERPRVPSAGHLAAAARERVVHADGRRL